LVDEELAGRCDIASFGMVVLLDQVGINVAAIDDIFDDFSRPTLLVWPSDGFVLAEAVEQVRIAHILVVIDRNSWLTASDGSKASWSGSGRSYGL
jgi:hypothetical protein